MFRIKKSHIGAVWGLRFPTRSLIDRPGSVGLDFGGGLYLAVIDPFEQLVLIEIDLATLSAARYLAQTGERINGLFFLADDFTGFVNRYRPPFLFGGLEPVDRSLYLLQFGEDLSDRCRNVFEMQLFFFVHSCYFGYTISSVTVGFQATIGSASL